MESKNIEKYVYVLFNCDTWKDKKSFNLLAIFDNFDLLKKEIKRMVDNGEAELKSNYINIEDMELIHISNIDFINVDKIKINEIEE